MGDEGIDFEKRLRRMGRPARAHTIYIRFTSEEAQAIEKKAVAHRTTVREWCRSVLLGETQRRNEDALFTELIAMRMLMVNLVKPLMTGKPVSQEWITELMAAVRKEKRKAAQEVRQECDEDSAGGHRNMASQWGRKETILWAPHAPMMR